MSNKTYELEHRVQEEQILKDEGCVIDDKNSTYKTSVPIGYNQENNEYLLNKLMCYFYFQKIEKLPSMMCYLNIL